MLYSCGLVVLFGEDGGSDGGPEAAGFVGELGGFRGYDFGGGVEGFEVDEGEGVLLGEGGVSGWVFVFAFVFSHRGMLER